MCFLFLILIRLWNSIRQIKDDEQDVADKDNRHPTDCSISARGKNPFHSLVNPLAHPNDCHPQPLFVPVFSARAVETLAFLFTHGNVLSPYYFLFFTPMVFLWNAITDDYMELDSTGLRLYRKAHFWARPRQSLSLNDIESVHTSQSAPLPFWFQWWGIQLLGLRFHGCIKVENKQGFSFYFGWNVTPGEAEEIARLMNEHLALLKG